MLTRKMQWRGKRNHVGEKCGEVSTSFLGDFTLVGKWGLDRSVPTVTEAVSGQEAGGWCKEEADGVKSSSMSQ